MDKKQIQAIALQYIIEKSNEQMQELAMSNAAIDPIGLSGWFAEYEDFADWLNPKFAMHADQIFNMMRRLLGLPRF